MALESAKNADLWRWKMRKMPIYGVGKRKKCRFMALESAKSSDLWRLKMRNVLIYSVLLEFL